MDCFQRIFLGSWVAMMSLLPISETLGEDYALSIRSIENHPQAKRAEHPSTWKPEETAVIICDVWDYHHSINAVHRLEEILPRLNDLVTEARKRGSIIIHAPSDCMASYEGHAARKRAQDIPLAGGMGEHWGTTSTNEVGKVYPLDQSDGGEDDDPQEHAQWAAKLKELGRNPSMPWKMQNPSIQIDKDKDYISDKGSEVFSILEAKKIKNVIMTGVHTNMCVVGRPFGLRKLVAHKNCVLVRDLTDCMYNPKRWPYVDHFTGNDLMLAYVERNICPTITSDQIVGGEPLRFRGDTHSSENIPTFVFPKPSSEDWAIAQFPMNLKQDPISLPKSGKSLVYFRCGVRFGTGKKDWVATLNSAAPLQGAWLNGKPLSSENGNRSFMIDEKLSNGRLDPDLLVICIEIDKEMASISEPTVQVDSRSKSLRGKWQMLIGEHESATNIPLPAKFGLSPEIQYEFTLN